MDRATKMLNSGAVCSEINPILCCSNPITTPVCYVNGYAIDTGVNTDQNFAHNQKGAFETAVSADGLGDLLQGNIEFAEPDVARL